jgi:hypothetical protein
VFSATEFTMLREKLPKESPPPRGIGLIKRAVNHANCRAWNRTRIRSPFAEIAGRSSDYDEGARVLEKRAPVFTEGEFHVPGSGSPLNSEH